MDLREKVNYRGSMRIDGISGVGNQPSFPQDSTIDINSSLKATYDLMCNPANTQTSFASWKSVASFMSQLRDPPWPSSSGYLSQLSPFIEAVERVESDFKGNPPKDLPPFELSVLKDSLSDLSQVHLNISSSDLAHASAVSLQDSMILYAGDRNNPNVHNDTGLQVHMLFLSQLNNPNVDALTDRMKTDIQHGNVLAVMEESKQLTGLLESL